MSVIKYKNIYFSQESNSVKAQFMKYFYFNMKNRDLERISRFTAKRGALHFTRDKAEGKFSFILEKGFDNMRTIYHKPATYIHMNSGIPLIGSNEFGIVDRGTNFIELKPITLCNLKCVFCSVDQDRRIRDFVVEADYLIQELIGVVKAKKNAVGIHIGGQGEPTMYSDLLRLVRHLGKMRKVNSISLNTNGILLDKRRIDALVRRGLTHFHISLNAFTQGKADELAGCRYPLKKVKRLCEYISKKSRLVIVPVWVPSMNDQDIEKIITFSKKIKADIGIQNYFSYKFGKKPVNALPMKVFLQRLRQLEEKHNVELMKVSEELKIIEDTALDKPFRKGQIIEAEIKGDARLPNTKIGVSQDRVITVTNCRKKGKVKAKIVRDKDNIFTGIAV
ncbi:radical SAM protein [Candidatus Woesearchaeota archaeon]|nr:radical SAM protein [Candidatus Woesearchaeota archaeon]